MKKILTLALLCAVALGAVSCSGGDDGGDSKPQYTVTFDADGGSPAPAAQKVKEGETVTAPPAVTRAGYAFLFWSQNGSTAYNFSTPVTANFTLTAHWQSEATVEYWQVAWELNGGAWPSGDNHAERVVKGGTLAEPAAPTKTGSTFDGWYKEEALTNKITFPYDVSAVTADFTLYANWKAEGGNTDPAGTFTSISALKTWLAKQPDNTAAAPHKIALKGVNLDTGNNWNDLGLAVGGTSNENKFIELDLSGCTGATIPDGYRERIPSGGNTYTINTYGVFVDCDNITSVTLPSGLTAIGDYAFCDCDGLTACGFPEGLLTIGVGAFSETSLKSVIIPEGVTTISERAFEYCQSLTSVTLPKGLQSIDAYAFYENVKLPSITIPAGVKSIGGAAFAFCNYGLEEVIMLPTTPPTLILGDYVNIFNGTASNADFEIKVPAASVDAYKTAYGWLTYERRIVARD